MTICLAGHLVGQSRNATRVEWGGTPGEASQREIKATPKEIDGVDLANIGGAKSVKHAIDRDDRMEEAPYRVGVLGPRSRVISKRYRIRNLIRAAVELWRAAKVRDQVQEARVKLGNGDLVKRKACSAPFGCCTNDCMVVKIEGDLHTAEPVFPDDLGVEVECRARLAPKFIGDVGPHSAEAPSITGDSDCRTQSGCPTTIVMD
jgi:hypothetical protein